MKSYDRRVWILAAMLSALAGYVDAIGFIALNGFFVSFMSGNSTRLGVGLAQASTPAAVALGLVGTFLAGVIAGSLTGHVAKAHRRTAVLVLVAVLLALAAGMGSFDHTTGAVALMVLAMGAENAVFERDGEVHIGLTYMTGTLVKLGQRVAMAFVGGDRFAWVPYLLLWTGLVAGACAGALVYPSLGLAGLWPGAAAAAVLATITASASTALSGKR